MNESITCSDLVKEDLSQIPTDQIWLPDHSTYIKELNRYFQRHTLQASEINDRINNKTVKKLIISPREESKYQSNVE